MRESSPSTYRDFGRLAGALTLSGLVLSGPVALAVVNSVAPQPAWRDAATFRSAYHPIQTLPYLAGFVLVIGSVMLVSALGSGVRRRARAQLAQQLAGVFAALVFLNYVVQTTFVPALVRQSSSSATLLLEALAMSNPRALAWALEMWGYAFLGVALWLVAPRLHKSRAQSITAVLLDANGIVSVLGALFTMQRLEWVFSPAGFVSFALWNVLYAAAAVSCLFTPTESPESLLKL